jgi:O-antigen ligase
LVTLVVSAVFAFFVAQGSWLFAVVLVAGAVFLLLGLARPVFLTVLWIVGMPTIFVFGNNILADIAILNVDRGLYLVLAGFLVARLLLNPKSMQSPSAVEMAMGAYLIVILGSWSTTLEGKDFDTIWFDVALLFQGFLMPYTAFVISRNIDWTPTLIRRVLWSLLGVGAYEIIAGLSQYFLSWSFFAPQQFQIIHLDRMTGSFTSSLPYGMVLMITLLLAMVLYLHTRGWLGKVVIGAVMFGLVLCVVLAQGRGVWLTGFVALIYVFIRCPRIRPLIGSGAVLAAVASPFLFADLIEPQSLSDRIGHESPIFNRVALYATALNMIGDHPIFGFGFGWATFAENKSLYYDSWGQVSAQWAAGPGVPHNEFLHTTILTGFVGLAAFLALLWSSWRLLVRALRQARDVDPLRADLALFLQGGFIVFVGNMLFLDMMLLPYVLVLMFFLLGIVARVPDARSLANAAMGDDDRVPASFT